MGILSASSPDEHRVYIERKFWDLLGTRARTPLEAARQRFAALCHEKAHDEGAECEECADFWGGQIFREHGIDDDQDAIEMFLAHVQPREARDAAAAFHAGFLGQALLSQRSA